LETIKTLSKGDIILISAAITHINNAGKVDFSSFYDGSQPRNLDLMITDIRKKEK